MISVDFEEIETMQREDRWEDAGEAMAAAARQCEAAGADFVVLCTNTMHKTTPAIEAALSIPFLHIGDATAAAVRGHGIETVAFLGTRYSMEQDFMTGRLRTHGLNIMLPDAAARTTVHDIIYNELVHGDIRSASRERYQAIIQQMATQGAAGVILGCTEIGLLIQQEHSVLPVFDTTQIHAETAVNWAIENTGV
jgi:aspartate racemase